MEQLGLVLMILAAVIAWDLIKRLLSSYFGEKGKNLATKEDIGKITEEVEGVKSYFTDRTEKLKSDLSADIQRQLSIFGKRNEAHAQFFEDSYAAVICLRKPIHYHPDELDRLDKHISEGQDRIVRAISSYFRLMIYVKEESISTPAHKAVEALNTLLIDWHRLMVGRRSTLKMKADELEPASTTEENPHYTQSDRPLEQALSKLEESVIGTLDALEYSLQDYCNALNAHFHSVDNSKALAATTGDSLEK